MMNILHLTFQVLRVFWRHLEFGQPYVQIRRKHRGLHRQDDQKLDFDAWPETYQD